MQDARIADMVEDAEVLAETAKIALAGAKPLEKNAYKVPLAQTLVRRALARAGGVNA